MPTVEPSIELASCKDTSSKASQAESAKLLQLLSAADSTHIVPCLKATAHAPAVPTAIDAHAQQHAHTAQRSTLRQPPQPRSSNTQPRLNPPSLNAPPPRQSTQK